ncbi:MAG: STAS/SEC14 domain-containing protein [Bacteroidota bacterium]
MSTSKELLFQNLAGTASIYHHSSKHCLEIALQGTIKESDYKEAFTRLTQELAQSQCCQVIFNNLDLQRETIMERAWFLAKFLPMAYKCVASDYYKAAVVAPPNPIQKMATQVVIKSAKAVGKPVDIQFFDEHAQALEWM